MEHEKDRRRDGKGSGSCAEISPIAHIGVRPFVTTQHVNIHERGPVVESCSLKETQHSHPERAVSR